MNKADLAAVQRIMRHQDPRLTTEVYGHLVPGYRRDAINKLPLAGAADLLPAKRAAEEAASFGPPVVRKMPAPESKGRIGFEQLTKIVGATSDLLSERTCRRTGTYLDPEFPHRHSSTARSTLAP